MVADRNSESPYSERSLFRQVVIPKGRYSERSLFRKVTIPKGRYSEGRYSESRYSERSLYRKITICMLSNFTERRLGSMLSNLTERRLGRKKNLFLVIWFFVVCC